MKLEKENLDNLKNQIVEILNALKLYYEENSKDWDQKNNMVFNELLGTLIITSKKIESIEKILNNLNDFQPSIVELLEIEVEEVEVIVEFYYDTFIIKKGV